MLENKDVSSPRFFIVFFFPPKDQVVLAELKSLTRAGTDKQQSCDLIVFINSLWKSFTIKHD